MGSLPAPFQRQTSSRGIFFLVAALFLGTQIFSCWGLEFVLYSVTVLGGVFYVFRHPGEKIWVTFFLIAFTCLLYPITVSVLGEPGVGDFRPYTFAIASMAGAMVLSMWTHRCVSAAALQNGPGLIRWAVALAGVFCFATIYGDLSPFRAEALYVVQQCSNWVSFFLFLRIGYKSGLFLADIQRDLERFRWVVLIYSIVFLAKFAYLDYRADLIVATEFAYAQRMALMFAGFCLVLTFASRLAPEGRSPTRGDWLSAVILVPAVVLSGSRGLAGAVILTMLVFIATWRRRGLLRLTLPLMVAVLVAVVILHSHAEVVEEYVVNKFLITPDRDASFAGRVAEMEAVAEALQRNPSLGSGTLASYLFFDPLFGWRETAFVDSGIGYLLLKTGLLGTSVFTLFVIAWLRLLSRLRKLAGVYALAPIVVVVFYLCFLPFGPSFFDIKYSWLIGIVGGYSLSLARICKSTVTPGLSTVFAQTRAPA